MIEDGGVTGKTCDEGGEQSLLDVFATGVMNVRDVLEEAVDAAMVTALAVSRGIPGRGTWDAMMGQNVGGDGGSIAVSQGFQPDPFPPFPPVPPRPLPL